jgi:hypothetical protein
VPVDVAAIDPIVAAILERIDPIKLLQVVPMTEAEELSSLSEDTLERKHSDKIIHLSARRKGMRRIHALLLGEAKNT